MIPTETFSLDDVYKFESQLKLKYPNNNFIKDKIRQQLQLLRDKGIIEFLNRGLYKKNKFIMIFAGQKAKMILKKEKSI